MESSLCTKVTVYNTIYLILNFFLQHWYGTKVYLVDQKGISISSFFSNIFMKTNDIV